MTEIWHNLSGKIDESTLNALDQLDSVTKAHGASFVVIGATARDFIISYRHGYAFQRATGDIDCAVLVPSWDIYDQIKRALTTGGQFKQDRELQRLSHLQGLPIDLVPFGPIAGEDCEIIWPPDHKIKMSTRGLLETHASAHILRIRDNPKLDVRIASLSAITLLKLIAWNDRPGERKKDASDLAVISYRYADAGNRDRFFNEHVDLVTDNFDEGIAAARLLGRDVKAIANDATGQIIGDILERELSTPERSNLGADYMAGLRQGDFERSIELLRAFKQGFEDPAKGNS